MTVPTPLQERVLARAEPASLAYEVLLATTWALLMALVFRFLFGDWREVVLPVLVSWAVVLVPDGVRWWRNLAGVSYVVTPDDLLVRTRRGVQTFSLADVLHVEVQGAATWRRMWGGTWVSRFPLLSLVTAEGHHTTPRVGIWGLQRAARLQADLDAAVERARS